MKTFSKLRVLSRFQQNKTFMTGTIGMFIVAFVSLILALLTNWILGLVWFVLLVAFLLPCSKG